MEPTKENKPVVQEFAVFFKPQREISLVFSTSLYSVGKTERGNSSFSL